MVFHHIHESMAMDYVHFFGFMVFFQCHVRFWKGSRSELNHKPMIMGTIFGCVISENCCSFYSFPEFTHTHIGTVQSERCLGASKWTSCAIVQKSKFLSEIQSVSTILECRSLKNDRFWWVKSKRPFPAHACALKQEERCLAAMRVLKSTSVFGGNL